MDHPPYACPNLRTLGDLLFPRVLPLDGGRIHSRGSSGAWGVDPRRVVQGFFRLRWTLSQPRVGSFLCSSYR